MTRRKEEKRRGEMIAAGETSDFPVGNDLQSASHIVFCSLESEQLHLHDSTETIHKMKKEEGRERTRERERSKYIKSSERLSFRLFSLSF